MSNPELMQQLMESPLMQNFLADPDALQGMLTSNPQIQQLMEVRKEGGWRGGRKGGREKRMEGRGGEKKDRRSERGIGSGLYVYSSASIVSQE